MSKLSSVFDIVFLKASKLTRIDFENKIIIGGFPYYDNVDYVLKSDEFYKHNKKMRLPCYFRYLVEDYWRFEKKKEPMFRLDSYEKFVEGNFYICLDENYPSIRNKQYDLLKEKIMKENSISEKKFFSLFM